MLMSMAESNIVMYFIILAIGAGLAAMGWVTVVGLAAAIVALALSSWSGRA